MAPDLTLEEKEEKALAELDGPGEVIDLTPEQLAELQANEGEIVDFDPNLPENFIEIIQERAKRQSKTVTKIETVMTIQGGDDEEEIGDGTEQEETTDDVQQNSIVPIPIGQLKKYAIRIGPG